MSLPLPDPQTPTPRTEQVARNIGKLLAEYKHGPLGLAETANLIDDALNGSRTIERELILATAKLEQMEKALRHVRAGLDGSQIQVKGYGQNSEAPTVAWYTVLGFSEKLVATIDAALASSLNTQKKP